MILLLLIPLRTEGGYRHHEMSNWYIDAAIQTLVFKITQQALLTAEPNLQSQPIHFSTFFFFLAEVCVQRCHRACVEIGEQLGEVDSLLLSGHWAWEQVLLLCMTSADPHQWIFNVVIAVLPQSSKVRFVDVPLRLNILDISSGDVALLSKLCERFSDSSVADIMGPGLLLPILFQTVSTTSIPHQHAILQILILGQSTRSIV